MITIKAIDLVCHAYNCQDNETMCNHSINLLQDNATYTGLAARDTAHALKVLTQAIRGVVTSPHTPRPLQEQLLNCAYDVMVKSGELINKEKNAISHPNDPENKARLAQVRNLMSLMLTDVYINYCIH